MSLHLVGGGQGVHPEVWHDFVPAARARAGGGTPTIRVVVCGDGRAEHAEALARSVSAAGPIDPVITEVPVGAALDAQDLTGIDGLLIGGGHTPTYQAAIAPVAADIRQRVDDGLPYAGFSAGSAIAPASALLGGWLLHGRQVGDEDAGEDLDELIVQPGLGLLDTAIDVHAAQWGTLTRLIAAVDAGLVSRGVAIDEHTALIVDGATRVVGAGSVWWVARGEGGVLVRRERAG